jgi:hypothetical protein
MQALLAWRKYIAARPTLVLCEVVSLETLYTFFGAQMKTFAGWCTRFSRGVMTSYRRYVETRALNDAVGLSYNSMTQPFDAVDIYIDDLLTVCTNAPLRTLWPWVSADRGPAYADDAAAVSFSPEGLHGISPWLRKWRMAANTVKSQTMIIHPRLMSRLQ